MDALFASRRREAVTPMRWQAVCNFVDRDTRSGFIALVRETPVQVCEGERHVT
jgi:hypothetical protein